MQVDYAAHDRRYQQLQADGKLGWTSPEELERLIARLEAVLRAGYAPRSGRVLELGCGAGDLSLWLATHGFDAHGVDIAPTAIHWANEKSARRGIPAAFRIGDVVTLEGYPDGWFDLVVDGLCLHCIIGDDRARTLGNVRRVLRPGGLLWVHTMCGDPAAGSAMAGQFDADSRCVMAGSLAIRYLGQPDSIIREIEQAGLTVLNRQVRPRANAEDMDDLLVAAARPVGG